MSLILYIVIPCYNEEDVINTTVNKLSKKLYNMIRKDIISEKSRIMLVNDGSKDKTWYIIKSLFKSNKYVTAINLSKNRGHQNALLAGLMTAKKYADIVVSMDADLQDDINVLDKFIEEYKKGSEIVYGVRKSRKEDTIFKKYTALLFYKLMKLMGAEIIYNHADYRLMSKKALDELEKFKEVNLFLRGIIPMIGFKNSTVEYNRKKRFAGETKYPINKMIAFAIEGITSFSVKPLKLITNFGIITSLFSFSYLLYIIIKLLLRKTDTVKGWLTLFSLICLFGGIEILCIGIVGKYIGKIYIEEKERPRYIIDEVLVNHHRP